MRIIADEVDGAYYVDIVLTPDEMKRVKQAETINGQLILKHRKYYVGVQLQGFWDEENDEDEATT